MQYKYFIQVRCHENTEKTPIIAGLIFENTNYNILGGISNWSRTSYHFCLDKLIRLHPNKGEFDMGTHPLDIFANFKDAKVSNGSLDISISLPTRELINILEESYNFRYYVRKGKNSKELIYKAFKKLFDEETKDSIKLKELNKVSVSNELFEVDVHIALPQNYKEYSINDFVERINFKSDLR